MKAELADEHRWLQQLTGRWRLTFENPSEAGGYVTEETWEEEVRSLGGAWVICETTGVMGDGNTATNILSLGYDPARRRYVGSFVSSAMTTLWIYEGTLDDSGTVLTLECEGPDFSDTGGTARYQDIITIKGEDTRNFASRTQNVDGTWKHVMSCDYTRIATI